MFNHGLNNSTSHFLGTELALFNVMKVILITIIFTLFLPSEIQGQEFGDYRTFDIETTIGQDIYKATVYQPTKLEIKKILIISPTIRGINILETSNAEYFSGHGYLVILPHLIVSEINNPNPNTDKLDSDYYRPATSAMGLVGKVEVQLNLPSDLPIFAMGSSLGGITTIILTANYPRIKAAWIAVAGGDLPHIYAHSTHVIIDNFRRNHMRELGIYNIAQYETYLRNYLINDPAKSCKDIRVPFHHTIATLDTVVPTVTQELLVKECPPHSVRRQKLVHQAGAMTNVVFRKEIKAFFEDAI